MFQPCIQYIEGQSFGFNYYVIYVSQMIRPNITCTIKYSMDWVGRMWEKKNNTVSTEELKMCEDVFVKTHEHQVCIF